MVKTLITKSAWQIITQEVEHFAYHTGASKEAIIYPLFGFITKNTKPIRKKINLGDIEYFIVTHAFAPPRELCDHHGARAGFLFNTSEEEEMIIKIVKEWSEKYIDIYPSLELGNVHSHQFATGKTSPSYGPHCDVERVNMLWKHLSQYNLNTALEIIICKRSIVRSILSYIPFFPKPKHKWNACCFGFDTKQQIVDIGFAEIVSDNDERVKEILTIPFFRTKEGEKWSEKQKRKIKNLGAISEFHWGWSSCRIEYDNNKLVYINFPPSFPYTRKIFYETYDPVTKQISDFHEWNINKPIMDFNLSEIINFLQKDK